MISYRHLVKIYISILFLFLLLIDGLNVSVCGQESKYAERHGKIFKEEKLYTSTHFEKIGKNYFVVDSYNNRVVFTDSLDKPVREWNIMVEGLSWPHSIASNGEYYLIDDTYANRVIVYKEKNNEFWHVKSFSDVGVRPHRVRYDKLTDAFYVLGSLSQTMTKIKYVNGGLEQIYIKKLPFLEGAYTRSFSIVNESMYFTSSLGVISKVIYVDDSYQLEATFQVPSGYENLIDLYFSGNAFYLTSIKRKILSCTTLSDLSKNECVDIYNKGFRGIPYYFSSDGNTIYVSVLGADNIQKFSDSTRLTQPEYIIKF